MLRFSNFPKKDHALASYSAIFLFVGTLLTQLVPQLNIMGFELTPHQATIVALVASACAVIGGAIKSTPALTWGGSISLGFQLLTLVIESKAADGTTTQKVLILATAILAILAKFTAAESAPADPLATGSKAGAAGTVIGSESPHAPQK